MFENQFVVGFGCFDMKSERNQRTEMLQRQMSGYREW